MSDLGDTIPIHSLHRPAHRRRHLQQIANAVDVLASVVTGGMEERRVEEHGVALRERELHVLLSEVVLEGRVAIGEVSVLILVAVGEIQSRPVVCVCVCARVSKAL